MADYDPLMYAPHAPGAPPPPQQKISIGTCPLDKNKSEGDTKPPTPV